MVWPAGWKKLTCPAHRKHLFFRSEGMEFGKVNNPEGLDLRLPGDPPVNRTVLSGPPAAHPLLRLGLTGWGEKAWVGRLYPIGTPSGGFLQAYSRSFESVELNSTFYAMPPSQVAERWRNTTSPGFRFMVKVPRLISHSPDAGPEVLDRFLQQLAVLGEKAPACFLQMPPDFDASQSAQLLRLVSHWPARGPLLFLEFRHASLLEDDGLMADLRKRGMALVITDTPGRRDLVHMQLLQPHVMVRFVASGEDDVDRNRLRDWSCRLAQWFQEGLEQAWFFCHTHDNLRAPEQARLFRDFVRENRTVWSDTLPEIKDYAFQQANLFQTPG